MAQGDHSVCIYHCSRCVCCVGEPSATRVIQLIFMYVDWWVWHSATPLCMLLYAFCITLTSLHFATLQRCYCCFVQTLNPNHSAVFCTPQGGDQPLFGRTQPPQLSSETKRSSQASIVANFVSSITAIDPNALIVVLGDLNDFQFSAPWAVSNSSCPSSRQ